MLTVASHSSLSKSVRSVGCIVHWVKGDGWGGDWHGFVMWAAADWRDRLPFDAQEVQ